MLCEGHPVVEEAPPLIGTRRIDPEAPRIAPDTPLSAPEIKSGKYSSSSGKRKGEQQRAVSVRPSVPSCDVRKPSWLRLVERGPWVRKLSRVSWGSPFKQERGNETEFMTNIWTFRLQK